MSEGNHQIQTAKIEPGDAIVPREDEFPEDADVVVERSVLTNEQLRKLAAELRPPAVWFAGDEENLF